MMVTCPQCQTPNHPDRQFCDQCGALLQQEAQQAIPDSTGRQEIEHFPDWLASLEDFLPEAEQPDESQDLPDWLVDLSPPDSGPLPIDETGLIEADMLDALIMGVAGDEALFDTVESEEPADPAAQPAEEEQPRKPVTGELTNVPPQLVGAALPDWLQDNPLAIDIPEGEHPPEEVPEWLLPAGEEVFNDLLALNEAEAAALASSGEWAALLEDLPEADPGAPEKALKLADIPEWLEALRPKAFEMGIEEPLQEPAPQAGPLAGFAGVIHIEPTVASPRAADRSPVTFSISQEQRQQEALLRQLMSADRQPPPVVAPLRKQDISSPLRVGLSFLLIAVIVIGLFVPPLVETVLPENPAIIPMQEAMSGTANRPALVAFEYNPAMAGELTLQAESLLAELAAQNSPVLLVSQSAAGLTIGEQTVQGIDGLQYETLALVPGEAVGLRQLGNCLGDPAGCASLFGQQLTDEQQAAFNDLGLILLFIAERDGLVSWMEQVTPQTEIPVVAGVTQALSPIAQPYFNSNQLQGLLNGFPAAAAYEQAAGQEGPHGALVWAVTLGQWVAAAALIVGNIFWAVEGPVKREP